MTYAEEVLVTKSELEEKKQRMSELETQASYLSQRTYFAYFGMQCSLHCCRQSVHGTLWCFLGGAKLHARMADF